LGIDKHFFYKTIDCGYNREAVNEILDEIVKITNETVEGEEVTYSFDVHKVTETRLKNVAHNVRRIEYLKIIDDIIPHWPRKVG
jgi:hypothetical protein